MMHRCAGNEKNTNKRIAAHMKTVSVRIIYKEEKYGSNTCYDRKF